MSKFRINDHVRITSPTAYWFDQTGVVAAIQPSGPYAVFVDLDNGGQVAFREHELILAESESMTTQINRAIRNQKMAGLGGVRNIQTLAANFSPFTAAALDEAMTKMSKASEDVADDYMAARDAHAAIDDSPSIAPTLSDGEKLRLIADVVNGQSPFGTELANFRKRLLAVLSIGERSLRHRGCVERCRTAIRGLGG